MKRYIIPVFLFIYCLIILSCSDNIEKDARKAAKLATESMELAKNKELDRAEEKYSEARKIMEKYQGQEEEKEFYTLYIDYLAEKDKK